MRKEGKGEREQMFMGILNGYSYRKLLDQSIFRLKKTPQTLNPMPRSGFKYKTTF